MKQNYRWNVVLVAAIVVLRTFSANGQGFVNLDFESATVADLPPGSIEFVDIASAFPGWAVFYGTNQQVTVSHNSVTVGAVNAGILGPQTEVPTDIIQGQYTAILQPGQITGASAPLSCTLTQSGPIPVGTRSIQMWTGLSPLTSADFEVSLGDALIPMSLLGQAGQYSLYAGDVSMLAGTSAELRITALATRWPLFSGFTVDDISFSSQAVPEPTTLSLLGLGLVGVGWQLRRGARK